VAAWIEIFLKINGEFKMINKLEEGSAMKKVLGATVMVVVFLSGCASVPMESKEASDRAKKFGSPPFESAGIYIYRPSSFGGALKKDVRIDGKCIGESAPYVFFYERVTGDVEHKFSTESEFSPNDLLVTTEGGKNYFIKQYIKMGVFVGGAGMELVDEDIGKIAVLELDMAKKGTCSE
jgi:hypothetical protein